VEEQCVMCEISRVSSYSYTSDQRHWNWSLLVKWCFRDVSAVLVVFHISVQTHFGEN